MRASFVSVSGTAGALFAALCCLGAPAILAIVSAVGLGFLINDRVLIPLLVLSLAVAVYGLVQGWRKHRNVGPLVVGLAAALSLLVFIVFVFVKPAAYAAMAALVVSVIWNVDAEARRRGMPNPAHAVSQGTTVDTGGRADHPRSR